MEDLRALGAGVCDDRERQKCKNEMGDSLEWACRNCPKNTEADIGEYTGKLLRVRSLRMAGYPLDANDLTLEEWEDLGRIEQWLQTQGQ